MSVIIFHLAIIVIAVYALIKGFRQKMSMQVSSFLGMAFGIVCSYVLDYRVEAYIREALPMFEGRVTENFAYSNISCAIIYFSVYGFFTILGPMLRSAMQVFETGILDSMAGAAFSLTRYIFALSIFYNLLICVDPGSKLVKLTSDDDGNLIEGVVLMAPSIMGAPTAADLAHDIQLSEAKKIS